MWQKGKAVPYCTDFVKGKRNRWTRKAHREHKIGVLNALWHLAPSSARTFLQKVSRDDPVPLVRQRAKKVLDRMHELRMAGLFQRYLDTGQDLSSAGLSTHCAGRLRYADRQVKRLARRACAKFRKASKLSGQSR